MAIARDSLSYPTLATIDAFGLDRDGEAARQVWALGGYMADVLWRGGSLAPPPAAERLGELVGVLAAFDIIERLQDAHVRAHRWACDLAEAAERA